MKDWVFSENLEKCDYDLQNSYLVDCILRARGMTNLESVRKFINCECPISNPSVFYDMDKFVERLKKSIENFEKICIFGDYDCDGITSTVMLYSYLSKKNIDVIYMLPSRFEEGYGLSNNVIDRIAAYGTNLIITVDNGISAYDEIEYANSLGIDTMITDHHKIPEKLPPALAIVNPKLNSDGFKDFAGVGVVFKAIQKLEENKLSVEDLLQEYGDLLSIGTIGDMVPMLGENRVLVSKSLKYFMKTKRPGTQVLLEGTSFGSHMDGTEISFGIVPKLNACGRIGSADIAAKLLLSTTIEEARSFLQIALNMNEERKKLSNYVFEDVEKEILENNLSNQRIIFAWSKNWHPGVIGIASSVICNKFGKPCFLFSIQGNEARGSARSIPGLDIHEYLYKFEKLLTKYGGHSMAAGVNIKVENLERFKDEFIKMLNKLDLPFYSIIIDYIIDPEKISLKILDQICKLSPFGMCNPEPIFGIFNVRLVKVISIGGGKHIRIMFSQNRKNFSATLFGTSLSEFLFQPDDIVDLAVRLKRNYFYGREEAVIHVVDIKFSDINTHEFVVDQRMFEDFISGIINLPEECIPCREDFVEIFNCIRENSMRSFNIERLYLNLNKGIRPVKIYLIMEIFRELGLFNVFRSCDNYKISIKSRKKVKLEESKILKKALRK